MDDLSKLLEGWRDQLSQATKLSTDEQAQITKAGAEVFKNELKNVTPVSNVNHKHAKDSVIMQNADLDGKKTGVSTVGYDSEHAYYMRMMNDGTKYYPRRKGKKFGSNHLNFYSRLFANHGVQDKVLNANALQLKKIMESKQGGNS